MGEDEIEILSVLSKEENLIKMPEAKQNLGHKRRRSATSTRPIAIAPKTNFPRTLHNVELGIKREAGFRTIIPRTNQIITENDQSNRSIGKTDQYEILDSLPALQSAKRIKLGNSDIPVQYIILQNQSLENCNANLDADGNEKITNQQECMIPKSNVSNMSTLQHYNLVDSSNFANSASMLPISSKLDHSNHQEQHSIAPNIEKTDFNLLHKDNTMESTHSSLLTNCNVNKESKLSISRRILTNNTIQKSDSLNLVSIQTLDTMNSLKARSQKPVVIMQQQLSPPNRTSSVKTKSVSIPGISKLLPSDIQSINIESKILSEEASPQKPNENFYETKIMINNATRTNNEEQETDFLLKKEFPVITSSQVDSVLKAIDMQGLNRGTVSNEVSNISNKEARDKEANDIGRSLPYIQNAANLCKNENTQCIHAIAEPSIKIQKNRCMKRPQSERHTDDYPKTVEKPTNTLQCFKCKECSYMSLNEKHIVEHTKRDHVDVLESKEKPILRCPGCSNTFHYEASLLSHIVHDHQVQESEARIMVHQLSYKQGLTLDNDSTKPISHIRVTTIQNEQSLINNTSDPLLGNDQRSDILPALPLPKIPSCSSEEVNSLPVGLNEITEISTLEYMQNVNNMPVIVRSGLEAFSNDDNKFLTKSIVQQTEEGKLLENKDIDCSEKPNLFELKTVGERNFEFVNFKNVSHNDGEGYLQEDDPIERSISDSEKEFVDLVVNDTALENTTPETKAVRMKKKGRPKGSKSYATKPQIISFKQGYKCENEDCGVRMLVEENIIYHQKCHVLTAGQRNISFQCPECIEFKSNNWNNLAGHLWRSHIIDMELHSCDLCSYKTPSFSHLTNQHRGIHGDDRPFICDECGKGFKTTKQLRNHRALHNAKTKKPLKCDECQRDFTNTRLLKLHKDSVHKESKPFTCSSCPYSAATRSALKLHLRRHTGEKPFSCEECSYSTGDHNSLRRHKLRHFGLKPYSCPHCSYACIQSSTYKVHLKNKHPGLDHNLMFSCQYCSYKSIKKDNLLTHMVKHEQTSSNKSLTSPGSEILVE